jgi:hypothetical protein
MTDQSDISPVWGVESGGDRLEQLNVVPLTRSEAELILDLRRMNQCARQVIFALAKEHSAEHPHR